MYGFSYSLTSLFGSYLSDSDSYVEFNSVKSDKIRIGSGVPQSTNLGPLLFNIFINDIVDVIYINCLLCSDNLKIYTKINDRTKCLDNF